VPGSLGQVQQYREGVQQPVLPASSKASQLLLLTMGSGGEHDLRNGGQGIQEQQLVQVQGSPNQQQLGESLHQQPWQDLNPLQQQQHGGMSQLDQDPEPKDQVQIVAAV